MGAKPGMRKEYKLRALVNNPNYRIETKKAPCNADDLENMKDHVEISESEDEILVEESEDEILLDGELMRRTMPDEKVVWHETPRMMMLVVQPAAKRQCCVRCVARTRNSDILYTVRSVSAMGMSIAYS